MKLKFTAEDFRETGTAEHSAAVANARLAEMLKDAPVVYGNPVVDVWEADQGGPFQVKYNHVSAVWGAGWKDTESAYCIADTAPHAICLAGLKACGVEI
jgi:hypothetical protein